MGRLFDVYKCDAWGKPVGGKSPDRNIEAAKRAIAETKAKPVKTPKKSKGKKVSGNSERR